MWASAVECGCDPAHASGCTVALQHAPNYGWRMSLELFSDRWAQQWCEALNDNAAYRAAAANWQGAVALVLTATNGGTPRGVYMDAEGGVCRTARAATEADLAGAAYVFEAA